MDPEKRGEFVRLSQGLEGLGQGCCLSAAVLRGVELYGEPMLLGLKHLSWELNVLASGRV